MRSSIRFIVGAAAVSAALLSARGAAAKDVPSCRIDPFTYDEVRSVIGDLKDNGTRVVEYAAVDKATFSGASCPIAGRTIGVLAQGIVQYEWDFDYIGNLRSSGRHVFVWDIDNDGLFSSAEQDLAFRGRGRGINDQTPADWNEVIRAQGPKGGNLTLTQTVRFDLDNSDAPILSLSAWGAAEIDLQ